MPRGFFLTFEGLDGSGKTTQIRRLAAWLEVRGEQVTITRQPGGTPMGDRIRTLLLESSEDSPAPMAELGLLFADRAQAIVEVIEPALAAGAIVLCDRFTDSTEAYQGGGRELGSAIVVKLHEVMCAGLKPDLTFLLLPDLEASLDRARRRNQRSAAKTGKDEGRFERENLAFYARVFAKYREIAAREPLRVVVVDGDAPIDQVHARIVSIVLERLHTRTVTGGGV